MDNNNPKMCSFDYMTDSKGAPITNDKNSLTVGCSGPALIQYINALEKIAHFDRERIPERVVHAKGAGAFGYFQNYNCLSDYTIANIFQTPKMKTPVFVRFSTVIGSKGSADTARDPRGFAVKFYTSQGNYDIVGNNLPVFFIRDAIQFPDVIHSLKPSPDTNLRDPQRFWDFISLTPESTHMITWLYSDLGTIDDYTHMDGSSVNTYVWINKNKKRCFVKYHWKTMQGLKTLDRFEADRKAGENPDIALNNLKDAIDCGNYPRWELSVQLIDPCIVDQLDFDPLDDTKTWPEDQFPLMKVGMMTLNKNPDNFFAQVEQSAFCPANLIPGVELSDDKMVMGRGFSYHDTQRYRLGANFMDLPINRSISPVNNNQRDGAATYVFNPEPINYSPNSLNQNKPIPITGLTPPAYPVQGLVKRCPIEKTNDFKQAGQQYRSYTDTEKEHLIDNMAVELSKCNDDIVCRILKNFTAADEEMGCRLNDAINDYRRKERK